MSRHIRRIGQTTKVATKGKVYKLLKGCQHTILGDNGMVLNAAVKEDLLWCYAKNPTSTKDTSMNSDTTTEALLKLIKDKSKKDLRALLKEVTELIEEAPTEFIKGELVEYGDGGFEHIGCFDELDNSIGYPYIANGSGWEKCKKLETIPIRFTPLDICEKPDLPDSTLIIVKLSNGEYIVNLVRRFGWYDNGAVGYQIIKDLEAFNKEI